MTGGVLELASRGGGFLRRREASYLPTPGDVHVGEGLIRRLDLRPGDEIEGEVGPGGRGAGAGTPGARGRGPRDRNARRRNGRGRGAARNADFGSPDRQRGGGQGGGLTLERVITVNGRPVDALDRRPEFARLAAVHPDEQLRLELPSVGRGQPTTNRVIDLIAPLGKGQRALIVAPAKAGKTMVLQAIAQGVSANYPEAGLFIFLVDERPEEVFEMEAAGVGEVIASSFDNPAHQHVQLAELTLERARRRVELGEDVVLMVDSLTRLARAYNTVERGTGRTLSGGLDAQSLERPKRFLGSARKVDPARGGGSLTIIATALVDTGSRMDQVIFEEFKGTGNSELVLSRELAERRIYPAIDLAASGTRREELLLGEEALAAARQLRGRLAGMRPADAMTTLLGEMRGTPSNAELVRRLAVA